MNYMAWAILLALGAPWLTAGLDRSVPRGVEVVRHEVPAGGPSEICVVPKHFDHATYRGAAGADDVKAERELCRYDLYAPGNTKESGAVATCPHAHSTSGSIEFQEITAGTTRQELENPANCGEERPTRKLTRFKTTDNDVTSTYVPGALLTYHLSRMLGDILMVAPAVLRTVDLQAMKSITDRVAKMSLSPVLQKSYGNYVVAMKNPQQWKFADRIFTTDYRQLYGFLAARVPGDTTYPGWVEAVSQEALEKSEGIQDVFSGAAAADLFGRSLTEKSLQRLQTARDQADLIVLDEIMAQGDRYTGLNLNVVEVYQYSPSKGELRTVEKRKVDKGEVPKPAGAMRIRRMVAIDNDCTITCENVNAQRGYVGRLAHINPRTYQGIMRMATEWRADARLRNFLAVELTMSDENIAVFESNLLPVADKLHANCVAGKLKLDLDPDVHFMGGASTVTCESK